MKRYFALFVCGIPLALAFACSAKKVDDSDAGVDNGGDASNDVSVIITTDGPPSILDGGGSSTGTCPATVDETSLPVWAAPKSGTAGACSESQITSIVSEVSTEALSDIYTTLNPKDGGFNNCQACVFGFEADPNWQVIVFADETMASGFLNFGACYAISAGGTAACAKAAETEKLCQIAACPDSCNNVEECFETADESVCGAEANDTETQCGASLNALTAACDNLGDVLRVVCGAPADGGATDAGAD